METNPETRRGPAKTLPVELVAEQRFNLKALIALGVTLGVAMMAGGQRAQAATMTPHTTGATVITTKAHAPIATIAAKEKAPPKPVVDSGDTAWTLTSTALVLFMTIPGLSLFYGGLVRQKNVLSVLMHCFAMVALVTVMWTVFGYSMAFSSTGMQEGVVNANSFIGQLDKMMLSGVTEAAVQGTIPELLWSAFQLTFAIITPALMIGAWAERFKFNAMMVFTALWMTAVYFPICHMVWAGSGSFLGDMGVLDFAGGIVVHITAGVGALIACILAGPRKENSMVAHNLPMTVMGTGMLWVGWYGFNAGSAITAGSAAAMAMVVTQLSASVAALMWMLLDVQQRGKVSALGMATGSIAGLAAITPASGFVGPLGGLVIGAVAGALCRFCSTTVKEHFGYDDSLDVFGVHGVGGFIGTILVGVFAHPSLGGNQVGLSVPNQLAVQAFAALLAIVYTVVASYALLKLTATICGGLSVDSDGQSTGMDIMSFDEDAYVV